MYSWQTTIIGLSKNRGQVIKKGGEEEGGVCSFQQYKSRQKTHWSRNFTASCDKTEEEEGRKRKKKKKKGKKEKGLPIAPLERFLPEEKDFAIN